MEKLIELLNEWERERVNHNTKEFIPYGKSSFSDLSVERITSKKYWFIKRLIENKKIDEKKIDTRLVRNVESHYDEEWYWMENSYEDYSNMDTLLMLLSISDTPIDYLISYLK